VTGLGSDIVDVSRMARSLARSPGFARFVFTDGERADCEARPFPERHYAARFAAKEGFLKALGRGVLDGVPLGEIEVVERRPGVPTLRLGPGAARALAAAGGRVARLSLSTGGRVCAALVVLD
jgi:holo-[acyl-carrier protein] synthase